jgi:hypothetical protein
MCSYTVHPYQNNEKEEIVDLLVEVFNGWPSFNVKDSLEYWTWKYYENPCGRSEIAVVEWNNKIIGCQHRYPQLVKFGDKKYPCLHGADLAVHPDHRRRGIYNLTADFLNKVTMNEDYLYNLWVSSNPVVVKSSIKRGSVYNDIKNLVRIKDIQEQLKNIPMNKPLVMKWGYLLLKQWNSLRTLVKPRFDYHGKIERVYHFDDRINEFWHKASSIYGFILVRDKDYLNWRFCDPRGGPFKVYQLEENNEIVGYIVCLINDLMEYHIGYIVEVFTLPDRLDVVYALVKRAVNFFDKNNVNIINYQVVRGHPYERVFNLLEFIDSRIKLNLFIMSLTSNTKETCPIDSKGRVFLSNGDHDSFPATINF